jgi:hypothetical protein
MSITSVGATLELWNVYLSFIHDTSDNFSRLLYSHVLDWPVGGLCEKCHVRLACMVNLLEGQAPVVARFGGHWRSRSPLTLLVNHVV